MSKNIEVTDEKYKGIKKVADSLGISPTEFVLRGVKACTLILDLFPEDSCSEKINQKVSL